MHSSNTYDMYEGFFIGCKNTAESFLFLFTVFQPSHTTRAPTRAYVKRRNDNEMRHVIHDTRISSGQCPRRDVTVRYGLQGHTNTPPP
jgi:hypothetical protein